MLLHVPVLLGAYTAMLSVSHDFDIVRMEVQFVAVAVVNVLVRLQWPSDLSGGNDAMESLTSQWSSPDPWIAFVIDVAERLGRESSALIPAMLAHQMASFQL